MGKVLHLCTKGTGISPARSSSYPRSVRLPPFFVLVSIPELFCMAHFWKTGRSIASDAVTVLEIPQKFAPLRLFRRGCGSFCPSARSEASENCQPPAHTSPDWSTSRSAPAGSGRALRQPPHSPATSSSATTASTAPYRDAEPLCLPCAEVLSCYRPKLCLMRSHAMLMRCMVSTSPPRSGWARWAASR